MRSVRKFTICTNLHPPHSTLCGTFSKFLTHSNPFTVLIENDLA